MKKNKTILLMAVASMMLSSCEFSISFGSLISHESDGDYSTSSVIKETPLSSETTVNPDTDSSEQSNESSKEEQPSSSESGLIMSSSSEQNESSREQSSIESSSEQQGSSSEQPNGESSSSEGTPEVDPPIQEDPIEDEFYVEHNKDANIVVNVRELPTFDGALELHISADSRAIFWGIGSQNVTLTGVTYSHDKVKTIYFEENIVDVKVLGEGYHPLLTEIHFSNDLEVLSMGLLFYGSGYNDENTPTSVYFEGDCPKFNKSVFGINGNRSLVCYYKKGSKGYDKSFISGAPFYEEGSAFTIPEWTPTEYAYKVAEKAEEMTSMVFSEAIETNTKDLHLVPEMYLDEYKKLREDTLEIVRDCKTQREKIDAIFKWVKNNIKYDLDYATTRPEKCYEDRKAVCLQYCLILRDMLTVIDTMSLLVSCWARIPEEGLSHILNKEYRNGDETHGHDILYYYLDGQTYACDPTWAANGNDSAYNMSPESISRKYLLEGFDGFYIVPDGIDLRAVKDGTAKIEADGEAYYFTTNYGSVALHWDGVIHNYFYNVQIASNKNDMWGKGQCNCIIRNSYLDYSDSLQFWDSFYCSSSGFRCSISSIVAYLTLRSTFTTLDIASLNFLSNIAIADGYCCESNEEGYSLVSCVSSANDIPEKIGNHTITAIGEKCFQNRSELTSLKIGDSITRIGKLAFDSCTNLKTVEFGENVQFVDDSAFSCCSSLTDIALNNKLEYLGRGVFGNTKIDSIELGKNVSFDYNPFSYCYSLSSVTVDDENPYLRSQGNTVYTKDWSTLIMHALNAPEEDFISPEGLKKIVFDAFFEAKNLKTVTLNSGVENVGLRAFACSSIESFRVEQETPLILESEALGYCPNLDSIDLGSNISDIGRWSFRQNGFAKNENNWQGDVLYCDNYAVECRGADDTYSIREGTTLVAQGMFYYNNTMVKLVLPTTLQINCNMAYENCTALETVVIQNPSSTFYNDAFSGCSKLSKIYFKGTEDNLQSFLLNNIWLSRYSSLYECVSELPDGLI